MARASYPSCCSRSALRRSAVLLLLPLALAALAASSSDGAPRASAAAPKVAASLQLPWREAGWSEREAAAILLDRLTYGPRPGEIDRVVAQGLDRWLAAQLRADLPDREVDATLATFKSVRLSARELAEKYPNPPQVLREAERAGVIDRQLVESSRAAREAAQNGTADGAMADGAMTDGAMAGSARQDRRELREARDKVQAWAREQGYRDQREALGELMAEKLLRATRSENQLREVLTDFWFNHFNVSLTDNDCRIFVPAYEREAIRPHVIGAFRDLLGATAKHPAMLLYLDNARSVAAAGQPVLFDRQKLAARRGGGGRAGFGGQGRGRGGFGGPGMAAGGGRRGGPGGAAGDPMLAGLSDEEQRILRDNRPQGLNENYARELMELHTLGVDGGYDQQDVVEVARAFSGWTTFPMGPRRREADRLAQQASRFPQAGFVVDGAFLFRADTHDAAAKKVLGHPLEAGRGLEDGEEVLDLLARQPATARHLATKMAARFVADQPSPALVDRLAQVYLASGGDLRQMVVAIVQSPEFWARDAREQKIKSPFELTASALRALDAKVDDPRPLFAWIEKMGQPLYSYQAPTGYPDRADAWVNTGALLNRMNFGLQLAGGRIGGIHLDLPALAGGGEPESLAAALATYVPLLLPERDASATISRLEPLVKDPELLRKIENQEPPEGDPQTAQMGSRGRDEWDIASAGGGRRRERFGPPLPTPQPDASPLAQVVGVILGSPEFQRR